MAIAHAHSLGQKFPLLGAGVPPEIQELKKLIQDGHPAGLQRIREPLLDSQESGLIVFERVQDQDILSAKRVLSLTLRVGRHRPRPKNEQDEQ
jgi:hypothetical protein